MLLKKRAPRAEILRFIDNFKRFDSGEVTRTFTNGYCYWFAHILHARFPDSTIMYYSVGKHFACLIEDRIYDIRGDITDRNLFFEPWERFKRTNPEEARMVTKYCIEKTGI